MTARVKRVRQAPKQRESRLANLLIVQGGPCSENLEENIASTVSLAERGLGKGTDFVVFNELSTTPYFCGSDDDRYFNWAEPVPGTTTAAFSELARRNKVNILLPLFEKGPQRGAYYNSAVFIDRQGQIVPGHLPDGTEVSCYRKCHIPAHYGYKPHTNEKNYFRPGPGLAVFSIEGLTVGCLICYDRSFPESWRMLALQGAQVVFLVVASYAQRRSDSFIYELRTAAVQNGLYIVACNKGGREVLGGVERVFFGQSCVIDPFGEVVSQAPPAQGPVLLPVTVELSALERYDTSYHYLRDRRPEIYSLLSRTTHV